MDRTERFYRIEMLIRNRGLVSFETLLDDLEVSRATLKRSARSSACSSSIPRIGACSRLGSRP